MTKDMYFEICETLGNEPLEEEIPIEFTDFPAIIQQTFSIYGMLRDIWDPMGGNYLGKDMSSVFDFFKLYEIDKEEQILQISFLQYIDAARSKLIASKKAPTTKPSPRKP